MVLTSDLIIKNELRGTLICCQKYATTLSGVLVERMKIIHWFKELCQLITDVINLINDYNKALEEKLSVAMQKTLLFYLTQLLTAISFLINIFVKEEQLQQVLKAVRVCATKQIVCCLEGIENVLMTGSTVDDHQGSFVKWVDTALEKVADIDGQNANKDVLNDVEISFEEVLAHAMSIAQVSLPEDGKIIRGSSQSVLNALNCLSKEIGSATSNKAMVTLFANACSDKLCLLERRVNTAVLKLTLKTFAKFEQPLQTIRDFCFDPLNKGKTADLDSLVVEFDLHVDRIMQIGLFSVACSNDFQRGIKIRSCLASLEAMESELVPTLTSVLLDASIHNVNCANILINHWLNQAHSLQQLIYLIIDPFAFCHIVYEEATLLIDKLSATLSREKIITLNSVDKFIEIVGVLKQFLNVAQTEFEDNESLDQIHSKLKDFNNVFDEVKSASKAFLNDTRNCFENSSRVLKRCKILSTALKRLWDCFGDGQIVDKEKANSCDRLNVEGNVFLDHIIQRGKEILQNRSVLYKTPISNANWKRMAKTSPLRKTRQMRQISFITASKSVALDLEITDILSEITNLSTNLLQH